MENVCFIGSSGATSLSVLLKVNSSLTQLDLSVSLLLNMINWLLLNHIPFITVLENQEQHHYQKYWRLIHHSLNWTWEWVYYRIWLIDYYWITFHFERYWRIREKGIGWCFGNKLSNHGYWVLMKEFHCFFRHWGDLNKWEILSRFHFFSHFLRTFPLSLVKFINSSKYMNAFNSIQFNYVHSFHLNTLPSWKNRFELIGIWLM